MKTRTGYSAAQIGLHWLIAVGIVFNYFVSEGMGFAMEQSTKDEAVTVAIAPFHVWIGVTILVLVALRIILRVTHGAPAGQPGILGKAATGTHHLLYLLMLLVPLAGAAAWFIGVGAAGRAHQLLANLLVILAAFHAAAGLYHAVVLKDGILSRMLRPA